MPCKDQITALKIKGKSGRVKNQSSKEATYKLDVKKVQGFTN